MDMCRYVMRKVCMYLCISNKYYMGPDERGTQNMKLVRGEEKDGVRKEDDKLVV